MSVASNASSVLPVVFGGILYTAQTGLNYRKLKKGKMTDSQFQRARQLGAYALATSIVGATGGAAVGFAMGSVVGPVGSIFGTVVGGIYGSIKGKQLGTELYQDIEDRAEKRKKQAVDIGTKKGSSMTAQDLMSDSDDHESFVIEHETSI